ncbi:MAG: hypothetical protein IPK42_23710 [Betaproteobacteria bacterium]|nr:hypothetical protein [Betaproteobacteria bacterium]
MLNAINDTSSIIGLKVNDPAAMVLAVAPGAGRGAAERNLAERQARSQTGLPVFRNVIEAVTYALFPLLVLLMLLTSGRETMLAFKTTPRSRSGSNSGHHSTPCSTTWRRSTPPATCGGAADQGPAPEALSLRTASTIYSAGDLRRSRSRLPGDQHPVHRMGRAQADGDPWDRAGGRSVGLRSKVAGARRGPPRATEHGQCLDGPGSTRRTGPPRSHEQLAERPLAAATRSRQPAHRPDGRQPAAQPGVRVAGGLDAGLRAGRSGASRQADAGSRRSRGGKHGAFGGAVRGVHRGLGEAEVLANTTGSTSSSFEQLGQTLNRLDQITKSVADKLGMSQSQVANIAFGAAAHLGLNTASLAGSSMPRRTRPYFSGLGRQERKSGNMTSEQLSEFKQFGDRVSRDSELLDCGCGRRT